MELACKLREADDLDLDLDFGCTEMSELAENGREPGIRTSSFHVACSTN